MSTAEGPAPPADPYDAEIDLLEYARLLWRRRWIVAAVTIIGGMTAGLVSEFTPAVYEATIRVHVLNNDPTVTTADRVARYHALLEDPVLAQQVVTELGLDKSNSPTSAAQFRSALTAQVVDSSDVIALTVRLHDQQSAGRAVVSAANHAVKAYQQLAQQQTDMLRMQLDGADQAFQAAQGSLTTLRTETQILLEHVIDSAPVADRSALLTLLSDIQAERARVRLAKAQLSGTARTIPLRKDDGARVDEVLNPVWDTLSRELFSDQLKLAGMEARLDALAATQSRGLLKTLTVQGAALARGEAGLTNADVYRDGIAAAYDRAMHEAAAPGAVVDLVGGAMVSGRPVAPRTPRDIAVGLGLGLFVAVIGQLFLFTLRSQRHLAS